MRTAFQTRIHILQDLAGRRDRCLLRYRSGLNSLGLGKNIWIVENFANIGVNCGAFWDSGDGLPTDDINMR